MKFKRFPKLSFQIFFKSWFKRFKQCFRCNVGDAMNKIQCVRWKV